MIVAANLTLPELERFRDFAIDTLRAAGAVTLPRFRAATVVDDKSAPGAAFDPVTAADREAESVIRAAIARSFPEHGMLGEEAGSTPGTGRFAWTIDPIDGTRGFIAGFVHWGMLLALTLDGRPCLGVVHQPWTGETWSGSALGAAFQRTDPAGNPVGERRTLATRRCGSLDAAVLATTDPYLFEGAEADVFAALRTGTRMTRYGADCYAYCMLASGQLDLVVESGLGAWDVQALMPVVEAAGGIITDWRGGDCSAGGQVVAAGDPALHALALDVLAPAAAASTESGQIGQAQDREQRA